MLQILPFFLLLLFLLRGPLNNSIKNYIFITLIVVVPVINNYFPQTLVLFFHLTALRSMMLALLLIFPLFYRNINNTGTKFLLSIILFYSFYFFRGIVENETLASKTTEFLFFIITYIIIENLTFEEKDLKKISIYLGILTLFAFFVSFKQVTGDGQFYRGTAINLENDKVIDAFENVTRNPSIFGLFDDGPLFMGAISVIFMFLYYRKKKIILLVLYIVSALVAILTFDRSAAIAPILALAFYIYFRNKEKKNAIFAALVTLIIFTILTFGFIGFFENTSFYQERILSKSYEARSQTLDIFFSHLIDKKIILGWGKEQHPDTFRKYGRGLGGSLNGFIGVYVYGGLIGLFLYLNIFKALYNRILLYTKKTNNYEFFIFPLSIIIYNFTLSVPYFFVLPSFLIFFLYFRMNEKILESTQKLRRSNEKKIEVQIFNGTT